MKVLRLFLLSVLVICVASVASAGEFYSGPDAQTEWDPCQGSNDPEICMWSAMETAQGKYNACQALASQDQLCQITMKTMDNRVMCASIRESANCQCNESTKQSTGLCTYIK